MGTKTSILDKVFVGILLVIFGGIVLHAPLSVGFSTLFPDYALIIKAWKEILMGAALLLMIAILTVRNRWGILRSRIVLLIGLFAALNLLLIAAYFNGLEATFAGLLINLRYFLFFVLVYVALRLYPQYYRLFLNVFIGGALLVVVFAVLQMTVLPADILKHIGYGESTIMPYLTVDENINYLRVNSTLRGPNPLGIFAVIAIAVALSAWLRGPRRLNKNKLAIVGVLGIGGAAALWSSYSRSAALAGLAAVGVILLVVYGKRISKAIWVSLFIIALVLTGSLVALRDTQFVSQIILHEDPQEGNSVNSNDGHAESLVDGTERMLRQPLGAGIGSTGSASLNTDRPLIIENQYLFVAHETGWVGLAIYLMVNYLVLKGLWFRRKQWLALGVFASGIGIAIAGLFLPVWTDDTVSIIWWGLAAIALALPLVKAAKKGKKL